MAGAPRYQHTQAGWVILGAMGLAALLGGVFAHAVGPTAAAIVLGIVAIVCVLFGTLTITIDEEAFSFRMGVGLVSKRIPVDQIVNRQVVANRWYYGWGIRLYPGGWLYNVSGLQAVELWLSDGRRLRVGTDEPEAVMRALDRVAPPSRPSTEAEARQATRRTRRYGAAIAVLVVAILGAVGVLFYVELQPPTVEIRETSFTIGSAIYDADVSFSAVTAISLEGSIPQIRSRTNGFAAGEILRGHFRIDGLGDGQLYVKRGQPPFVRVVYEGGYVYLGYADPRRTEAAFKALDDAWRGAPAR